MVSKKKMIEDRSRSLAAYDKSEHVRSESNKTTIQIIPRHL